MGSEEHRAARPEPRQVRARKVSFDWGRPVAGRHFVGDDLVLSHLGAMASSVFPPGEAFFVRSVRAFRSSVTDPELAAQVAAFIGQESRHAREHQALNERLAQLGYPTRHLTKRAEVGLRVVERILSRRACLAVTAMLEHATATLADVILSSEEVRALFADEQIRDLVVWHALEESEHRAVAFDVYRAIGGPEWLRTWPLRIAVWTTGLDVVSGVVTSMAFDPDGRRPRAVWRSLRRVRRSPFAGHGMGRALLDYTRADFHPSDHARPDLLEEWSARLAEAGSAVRAPA